MKQKSAAQEHFGPLLGYCDHQMMKLMVRKLRQYDVSPMQCRTLTFLYEQQEDVTQKRLQEFLRVKPSTVNGIVERLEEKHYKAIHKAMEQALGDGALGVSLGLGYAPECFYTTEELIRALAPLAGQSIPVTVHMRQEGGGVLEGLLYFQSRRG